MHSLFTKWENNKRTVSTIETWLGFSRSCGNRKLHTIFFSFFLHPLSDKVSLEINKKNVQLSALDLYIQRHTNLEKLLDPILVAS